jgi:hypothetical protein
MQSSNYLGPDAPKTVTLLRVIAAIEAAENLHARSHFHDRQNIHARAVHDFFACD